MPGMKAKYPIPFAILILSLLGFLFRAANACSIFCDCGNGTVLAGRNWDMTDDGHPVVMWFVPATNSAHGRVCFGRHDDCEDGMNDKGLFVAIAATDPNGAFISKQPPIDCPQVLERLLSECANIEEAIAWLKKTPNITINGFATAHRFLGL